MDSLRNIEIDGEFSPFIRFCIGIGILLLAASPLILAIGKVLHWIRWW